MLKLSQIRTDGGTQVRASLNDLTVAEYAEAMADPDTVFPPVIVYHDGTDYWLADGFHRVAAWKQIGRSEVPAEIRPGTRRDAILHACAANSAHGLRRTNADKRRAVETLLRDEEWSQWSDREIARRCAVHHGFVAKIRRELNGYISIEASNPLKTNEPDPRKFVDRYGNTSTRKVNGSKRAENERHAGDDGVGAPHMQSNASDHATTSQPAPTTSQASYAEKRWHKLSEEGRFQEWIELHAEIARLQADKLALNDEVARLKQRIAEFEADGSLGQKLGEALRKIDRIRGRSDEWQAEAARLKRQVLAQKNEIDRLRREMERQEIPL